MVYTWMQASGKQQQPNLCVVISMERYSNHLATRCCRVGTCWTPALGGGRGHHRDTPSRTARSQGGGLSPGPAAGMTFNPGRSWRFLCVCRHCRRFRCGCAPGASAFCAPPLSSLVHDPVPDPGLVQRGQPATPDRSALSFVSSCLILSQLTSSAPKTATSRRSMMRKVTTTLSPRRGQHFTGRLPPQEVFRYLATADLGVDASLQADVSPVKVFEYMAFGLAVVAFDLRETRALSGSGAMLVEPGDTDALAGPSMLSWPARSGAGGSGRKARPRSGSNWRGTTRRALMPGSSSSSAARSGVVAAPNVIGATRPPPGTPDEFRQ